MLRGTMFVTTVVGVVSVLYAYGYLTPYTRMLMRHVPDNVKSFMERYIDISDHTADVKSTSGRIFTKDELWKYRGEGDSAVYLAVLGQVFDVTKGRKHYGPGGGYEFFSGRDGTRAYVSGDFTEAGLIDDITGLSLTDIRGLDDWIKFYKKDYIYVGKVVGNFYNAEGTATEAYREYEKQLATAEKEKVLTAADYRRFPPCNSESAQGKGRRLWCSNLSGGIQRDWTGLPREYYRPGTTKPRCACVKDVGPPSETPNVPSADHRNVGDLDNPNMKVYPGCEPKSVSCSFNDF
ncbi:neuferricin-like [Mizuhopecten yessoensis]|uniref:Neuferricin n=1 Tax=Mizuhopecten yessoensis TaxID=6573 RepID=A0A210Q6G8_MIZYE|nr:neuferricin-like [Mizuhopecten yessoensis]OWF44334.1 Neuferricin [Mizuhopecten yessoensis]